MSHYTHFVGIDVCKDHLDVHCLNPTIVFRVPNTSQGVEDILDRLGHLPGDTTAFACEATGRYETTLLVELNERNRPVWRLHPTDIRAFAKLLGRRAKNDRIDANLIAVAIHMVADRRVPTRLSRAEAGVREQVTLRRYLQVQISTLKSQRSSATNASVIARLGAMLAQHEYDLRALDAEIMVAIQSDPASTARAQLLREAPGVGPVLVSELIANLPELGQASSRQIASLVGVAPHPRQSGSSQLPGRCGGGRASLRRTLYMAALSAIRMPSHPLHAFYQRLRTNGKPFKVAITAVMRKFITMLNAMCKSGQQWYPKST